MKKLKMLLVLVLVFGITYIAIDRHLFYYGKSNFKIYNLLPFKIHPEYRPDFEGGFALKDKAGFTVAAKKNTYNYKDSIIIIEKVLKYYFDKENLIAYVKDLNETGYYIEFTGNGENELNAKIWGENDHIRKDSFREIEIKNNEKRINTLDIIRSYIKIIFIALLVIITFGLLKKRKAVKGN